MRCFEAATIVLLVNFLSMALFGTKIYFFDDQYLWEHRILNIAKEHWLELQDRHTIVAGTL